MIDVREGRQRHRVGGWGWGGEVVRGGRQDAGAHLRMVFLILLQDLDAQLRQVHDVFQFLLWRHIFTQHFCSQQQPQLTHPLACSTLLLTATTPSYTPSGLLNPSAHSNNPILHTFWLAQPFCSQQQPQLTHLLACSTLLLTATTPTCLFPIVASTPTCLFP